MDLLEPWFAFRISQQIFERETDRQKIRVFSMSLATNLLFFFLAAKKNLKP